MRKERTRLGRMAICFILSLCMVVTMMPMMAWAAEPENEPDSDKETVLSIGDGVYDDGWYGRDYYSGDASAWTGGQTLWFKFEINKDYTYSKWSVWERIDCPIVGNINLYKSNGDGSMNKIGSYIDAGTEEDEGAGITYTKYEMYNVGAVRDETYYVGLTLKESLPVDKSKLQLSVITEPEDGDESESKYKDAVSFDGFNSEGGVNVILNENNDDDTAFAVTANLDPDVFDQSGYKVKYSVYYWDEIDKEEKWIDSTEKKVSVDTPYSLTYGELRSIYNECFAGCGFDGRCNMEICACICDSQDCEITEKYFKFLIFEKDYVAIEETDMPMMPGRSYSFDRHPHVKIYSQKAPAGDVFDVEFVKWEVDGNVDSWYDTSETDDYFTFGVNGNAIETDQETFTFYYEVEYEDQSTDTLTHQWTLDAVLDSYSYDCQWDTELLFSERTELTTSLDHYQYNPTSGEAEEQDVSDVEVTLVFQDSDCKSDATDRYTTTTPTGHGTWEIKAKSLKDFGGTLPNSGEDRYLLTIKYDEDHIYKEDVTINVLAATQRIEQKNPTDCITLISGLEGYDTINLNQFKVMETRYNLRSDSIVTDEVTGDYTLSFDEEDYLVDTFQYDKAKGTLSLYPDTDHENCYTHVEMYAQDKTGCSIQGAFLTLINPTAELKVPRAICIDVDSEGAVELSVEHSGKDSDVKIKKVSGNAELKIENGMLIANPRGIGSSKFELTIDDTPDYKGVKKTVLVEVSQRLVTNDKDGISVDALDETTQKLAGNSNLTVTLEDSEVEIPDSIKKTNKIAKKIELMDGATKIEKGALLIRIQAKGKAGLEQLINSSELISKCIDADIDDEPTTAWIEESGSKTYICFVVPHLSNYVLAGDESMDLSEFQLKLASFELEKGSTAADLKATVENFDALVPADKYSLQFYKDGEKIGASDVKGAGVYSVKAVAIKGEGYCGETVMLDFTIAGEEEHGGGGTTPTNEELYDESKTSALAACDALAMQYKDSKFPYIAEMIESAKKEIAASAYDKSKSLAENQAIITTIVEKLNADVEAQKTLDDKSTAKKAKVNKVKITQNKLKTYKKGHKIKVTFKRTKADGKYVKSYQIYRKTGKKGAYKRIKTVNSSKKTMTYTNKKLKKGKYYYYKVRGVVTLPNGSKAYTKWSSTRKIKCK